MAPYTLKKDSVYHTLSERLRSGFYAPGERLPNEKEFSIELGVSLITLRPALKRLEKEGALVRIRSKGTFVATKQAADTVLIFIPRNNDISCTWHYILPGIEAELSRRNLKSQIAYFQDLRNLSQEEALKLLQANHLRGALLITSSIQPDDPEPKLLNAAKLPAVFLIPDMEDLRFNIASVYVNAPKAWHYGIEFLFQSGYRRIAVLESNQFIGRGSSGEALREYGVAQPEKWIFQSAKNREEIFAVTDRILSETFPDVIYCFSDFFAVEVIDYLKNVKKLRIPQDIAVMGFCGYPGREFLSPPLSTIDYRYKTIGEEGVKLLCRSNEWFGMTTPQIELPFYIDERESTKKN